MKIKYSYMDKSMSRFIFASYVDDSNDKYTRVYVTDNKSLTSYMSGQCKQIVVVLHHLTKREKDIIIDSYCSGVDEGRLIGRQQIKDEFKRFLS